MTLVIMAVRLSEQDFRRKGGIGLREQAFRLRLSDQFVHEFFRDRSKRSEWSVVERIIGQRSRARIKFSAHVDNLA